MIERKLWTDLGFVLFGFLTCFLLMQSLRTYQVPPEKPPDPVYILHKKNINYTLQTHTLPSEDYSKLINLTFNFTILNYPCNDSQPLLLVLVHTSPKNIAKRKVIRETWGQHDDNIKILFLIGSVESNELQTALENENRLHLDFIQGDFLDTYRNITYKHVMAFKYSIYHCSQAKYILKTDDDVFVNMPSMKNFLTNDLSPYGASRLMCCTPRKNSLVLRSYRSKWRVSFDEYKERNYPTYCPGWALLYSPDVVFALYNEAQKTDYFWIDDVHITGTLMLRINLTHTNIQPLVLSGKRYFNLLRNENNNNDTESFLYGAADLSQNEIRALWKYATTHTVPKYLLQNRET